MKYLTFGSKLKYLLLTPLNLILQGHQHFWVLFKQTILKRQDLGNLIL